MQKILLAILITFILCGSPLRGFAASRDISASWADERIKQYLLNNPEVIAQALQNLQAKKLKEQQRQTNKIIQQNHTEIFSGTSNAPDNADVVVVEFFDYGCHYCQQVENDFSRSLAQDTHVKVIYKELPILGETSKLAALAALAAEQQGKYLEFHHKMLTNNTPLTQEKIFNILGNLNINLEKLNQDMQNPAIDAKIMDNINLAQKLGIHGTPAFIVAPNITTSGPVNQATADATWLIPGAISLENFLNFYNLSRHPAGEGKTSGHN